MPGTSPPLGLPLGVLPLDCHHGAVHQLPHRPAQARVLRGRPPLGPPVRIMHHPRLVPASRVEDQGGGGGGAVLLPVPFLPTPGGRQGGRRRPRPRPRPRTAPPAAEEAVPLEPLSHRGRVAPRKHHVPAPPLRRGVQLRHGQSQDSGVVLHPGRRGGRGGRGGRGREGRRGRGPGRGRG